MKRFCFFYSKFALTIEDGKIIQSSRNRDKGGGQSCGLFLATGAAVAARCGFAKQKHVKSRHEGRMQSSLATRRECRQSRHEGMH